MMETSTSINQLNYEKTIMESTIENIDSVDLRFYQNLKPELDALARNPLDETINKILAYSMKK
ncbi:hypothetical protein ACVWYN_003381 [Pedobacter sp. UYP24]